jgi:hypothetical protein
MRLSEGLSLKTMFESEEDKALAFWNLGTKKELSADGIKEFIDFIFAENTELRDAFLSKVVEAYKTATKKK